MKKWCLFIVVIIATLCFAAVACAEEEMPKGWIKDGTHYCYYENGVKLTGHQTIYDSEFDFTDEGYLKSNGQIQQILIYGYVYLDANNEIVTGWQNIDGDTYYFAPEDGLAAAYSFIGGRDYSYEINGVRYAFAEDGKLVKNGWVHDVYGDSDGKILTGYQKLGDYYYLFNDIGCALRDFQEIDGKLYYFNTWPEDYHVKWFGWVSTGSHLFYCDPQTGVVQTSPRTIDGRKYNFDETGRMIHDGDILVRFDEYNLYGYDVNDELLSGWRVIDGETYNFFSGHAHTHVAYIDENYYYFDDEGRLQRNKFIWTTSSELYSPSEALHLYYFGSDGKRLLGWQTINGSDYYFDAWSGANFGHHYIDMNGYFFDEEGRMQKNCFQKCIRVYWEGVECIYYFGPDGKQLVGWQTIDGDTYYFDYHYGAKTGTATIDDKTYHFTEEGKLIISPEAITLDKTELTITEGTTAQLSATINPSNAANKKLKWNSDKPGIVKVDSNGLITAVSPGTAKISVTTEDGEKTAICVITVEPKDKVKGYVIRCYNIILGREPDAGGMKTWYNELVSGRKAASEIIDNFVRSQEFLGKNYSNADAVEILYKAMLGRGSDPAGKADWVGKLDAGYPFAVVINGFCGSKEFKEICDSYGIAPGSVSMEQGSASDQQIRAFVTRCYRIILGRDPDEVGMNTWFSELKSRRRTAAEIIEQFVYSQEFQNKKYSNPDAVEILYKAMLGRGSDPAGKADWVGRLNAGQPLTAIINGFCGSMEFNAICEAYGITPGSVKVETVSRAAEEAPEEIVQKPEKKANLIEITNPSDTVNEQLGTAVQAIYINEEKAKEFIGRCYRVILGREASQAELDSWIGQMMNGSKTADQIARGFLFSGEFKGRNIGNEELVKILYRVYMNREADPEGLATWTQKLDEGISLNDLLNVFAKTGEFKNVVRAMGE